MNFLKIPVPFFRRKVRQRTSLKKYHFIFAKFLRFRRTFYKKFFGRGLGRIAPTDNAYKKTRCKPRFFNLSEYVGTAVPNLRFKGLLKKPLKNPQNFRIEYAGLLRFMSSEISIIKRNISHIDIKKLKLWRNIKNTIEKIKYI